MKRTLNVLRQHLKDIKEMPKNYYYHKSFEALRKNKIEQSQSKIKPSTDIAANLLKSLKLEVKGMVEKVLIS